MKIFYAGHNNFGNRGCEALVRSVSGLIRENYPNCEFITPSVNIDLDARQWPDAKSKSGIQFIEAARFPSKLKWWNRVRRFVPAVEKVGRPSYSLPSHIRDAIQASHAVVMTGGDTISLDYDLPSLYDHAGYIDEAKRQGKKAFLWGASVGPFSRLPHVEKLMKSHLSQYDAITVRESETFRYLSALGVKNVVQVTDPAFTMYPEAFDCQSILPAGAKGIIGINVSPLIRGFRGDEASKASLDRDVALFARELAETHGYGVVLLPHVGPLDGNPWNSDYHYMKGLVEQYDLTHPNIVLAPSNLNAAQLKFLISKFRFFIGARTHATIGAFSTLVPTISIAYSVKAKGINKDLFGDTRLVLDTPKVSLQTLRDSLALLEREEDDIRRHLESVMPEWKRRAALSAQVLADMLQG